MKLENKPKNGRNNHVIEENSLEKSSKGRYAAPGRIEYKKLPLLVSEKEMMQLYKCSKQTIRRKVKQGKIPCPIVNDGKYLFFHEEVLKNLESKRFKQKDKPSNWNPN